MTQPSDTPAPAHRKLRWPVLLAFLALALLGSTFYKGNPLTRQAESYATSVATASAGIYVSLRTLNAFLSTAQEIQVEGSALVVSGSGQPLRWLEPVDDTIERIAGMVFLVMVATGVISVAVGPIGAVGWGLVGLAVAGEILRRITRHTRPASVVEQTLLRYGLLLALALPLAYLLAGLIADWMTADVWAEHSAVVARITAAVPETQGAGPEAAEGWLQSLRDAGDALDRYQHLAEGVYENADELIRSYLMIFSVFLFKLLILPALILLGIVAAARRGR
ncbi:hypothetical protein PSA7680_02309 [Pseudoruegeria aquimaris]|uniref:Uncharacterized protein n=1 Tax=Pseudoruegeria aquimaris TaxID=393663 RepID=A0A1Y5SUB2_9RHOB|nr:hypothetical protein [Pseudoruegeria aquimaris]SLN45252.1 hypothetical protein PSA7680_02309 [Pseudoruegeria aquimaris]